jgi:DNA-damage-inducible protein J
MVNGTTIQTRVDIKTKQQAKGILEDLGLSMSQAITLYLRQIVFRKAIPFEIKIPNDITLKTVEKLEAGKDTHQVSSVDDLFKEINS